MYRFPSDVHETVDTQAKAGGMVLGKRGTREGDTGPGSPLKASGHSWGQGN